MDILFKKCILYNSKFSLRSEYMGINGIVVKRVHYVGDMLVNEHMEICFFIVSFQNNIISDMPVLSCNL